MVLFLCGIKMEDMAWNSDSFIYTYTYVHTYITLHYITLHCIALQYITLHYITSHYITYIHTYGLNPVSSLTGKLTYLFHESQGII